MAQWRYWYPLLVKAENSLLKNDRRVPEGSLVICKQRSETSRGFSIYYPFYTFIQDSYITPLESRCFFEVILGGQAQKPYFDLDIDLETEKYSNWTLKKAKEAVKDLIRSIIEVAPSITGTTASETIKETDIMVFSSHGKTKFSFHVVVDRWCFPDYRSNKYFCEKVISNMVPSLAEAVDERVYKSLQQFRTYMSTKYLKGRVKILENEELCKWQPMVPLSDNPAKRFYQISYASFVSLTSTCKIIGYQIPEAGPKRSYDNEDLSDAAVTAVQNSVDSIVDGTFSVYNIDGHMIVLKRLRPAYCVICDRQHEAENAFLTVSSGGCVFFHCFRADTATKVPLTTIDAALVQSVIPEYSGIDPDLDVEVEIKTPDLLVSPTSLAGKSWKPTTIEHSPEKQVKSVFGLNLYKSMTQGTAKPVQKDPERKRYLFKTK